MSRSFRSSQPDAWTRPRQSLSGPCRLNAYGKVQPMPHDRRDVFHRVVLPALGLTVLFVLAVFVVAALR